MDEEERRKLRNEGYPPGAVHEEQRKDEEARGFTADPHKAIGGRPEGNGEDVDAERARDAGGETTGS